MKTNANINNLPLKQADFFIYHDNLYSKTHLTLFYENYCKFFWSVSLKMGLFIVRFYDCRLMENPFLGYFFFARVSKSEIKET